MIQVYKNNNTNYSSNGDMNLDPSICIAKIELNGICELELEHRYDNEGRWKDLIEDNVIAASTPWSDKQLFRIYSKIKTMTGIKISARHVFFDLINYILLDVRPTAKNGQEALNIILQNTPFTGSSNITTVNTSSYVRKNIVEALAGDDENSFINRWGGERLYDNFTVNIINRLGSDKGVRAEFGYNLEAIEEEVSIDDVVTRIIPTGYNGIILEGPTPWVNSPNINKYAVIKTQVINFDEVKVKENSNDTEGFNTLAEAQQELIRRCNELFTSGIDQPRVNYKVGMVDLAKTTAYKDFIQLENVGLGDTVTCRHDGVCIDIKARCISMEWDCISDKLIGFELGNFEENYFNNQSDITSRVEKILNKNGTVKGESLEGTINALNTLFKAQRDIAQKQNIRAMLFEDRITDSPTFGAMCLGTMGFEIASSYKPGTTEWDFRTFGTGKGFVADCIVAGTLRAIVLESLDGSCKIDLGSGIINISKGIIKGLNSSWNLDTGIFKSIATIGGTIRELILSQGGLYSNHNLYLEAKEGLLAFVNDGSGLTKGFTASTQATGVSGQKVLISSADEMQVIADCKWQGNLKISGTLTVNGKVIG